jgi:NAD+ kinase
MKVAIHGQFYKESTQPYIEELLALLETNGDTVFFEEDFYDLLKFNIKALADYKTFSSYNELDKTFDIFVTLGGDGTILRATTFIRDLGIPILGINVGRLGFLATIQKNEIKLALENIRANKYSISERSLLKVSVSPTIPEIAELGFALNEITVGRKNTTAMVSVETHLDKEKLTSYWADGLIIATPTGSTGYSLSCGGPVVTPGAKSIIITPIAPHNLNARPLVIPDETYIELKVNSREKEALLSLDSRTYTITNDTKIVVERADFTIKLIQLPNKSFLKTIRRKLLWGVDRRN